MDTWRLYLAIFISVVTLLSYIPYITHMIEGSNKPHAFSWLIWAITIAVVFVGQVVEQGGYGVWVTGITMTTCFGIFLLALIWGEKNITRFDWWCLFSALIAIPLWVFTATPLYSIIWVTLIDLIGYFPTFRKTWANPFEETISVYVLAAFKFAISIVLLENINWVTALYPASIVLIDVGFVAMVFLRRQRILRSALNC